MSGFTVYLFAPTWHMSSWSTHLPGFLGCSAGEDPVPRVLREGHLPRAAALQAPSGLPVSDGGSLSW